MLPFAMAGLIGIIFTSAIPEGYRVFWFVFCLGMIGVAMYNAATKRPCGHGYINQGKWGASWPYVIRRCPTCGEAYE